MPHYKFILAGDTGSGKTSQFLTMPKPRFAQLFDPAATSTLGDDEWTEEWFPKTGQLPLRSRSFDKEDRGANKVPEPQMYNAWAKDLHDKLTHGFFEDNKVQTYMLDSLTLLGMHCLQHQRWYGRADERMDHRRAGEVMVNAVWALCHLPCHVILTVHTKFGENDEGRSEHRFTIPGGSKLFVPRFVSGMWFTQIVEADKGPRWTILTRPQRGFPHVRTPRLLGPLDLHHDVTIEDWEHTENYGIGGLISKNHEQ